MHFEGVFHILIDQTGDKPKYCFFSYHKNEKKDHTSITIMIIHWDGKLEARY